MIQAQTYQEKKEGLLFIQ